MLSPDYTAFLAALKAQIQQARLKAMLAVNTQLIDLYWWLGARVLEAQKTQGWGAKVIDRLSADLQAHFPDMKGLSTRNLKYMRQFAEEYPDFAIVQLVVAQLAWAHHLVLMDRISDKSLRLWYAKKSIEEGWSKRILAAQIELKAHETVGNLPNNFAQILPPAQSDFAKQIFRDEYIFDFIAQSDAQNELAFEKKLTESITNFLLALGKGFAFVGRQYHLEVGGQDFYIDMLFYHTRLHCYIVVELKIGEFKPEYTGKLNFYLSAVDDLVRQKEDNSSIGLLLCKSKNSELVEFSLRDMNKPMGVASYHLTHSIPENLRSNLPTEEELKNIFKMIDDSK